MENFEENKKIEKNLGPTAKKIGTAIQAVKDSINEGATVKISLYNLKEALLLSMKNHGFYYQEETIKGYLHGKAWPQMSKETTIEIIGEAFESTLNSKGWGEEVEGVKQTIADEINKIYSEYEDELIRDVVARTMTGYFFRSHYKDAALFVSRNIEAFSSLTAEDIEFWDSISFCTAEQKKDLMERWSGRTIQIQTGELFKTVTSPAFCQWVTIRDKDYSDSARKERKEPSKLPRELEKRLEKMTEAQTSSLLAVAERLEVNEDKRHPLCPPDEIDLLLLFKYFLTDTQRAALLEEGKNKKIGW